MIHRHWWRLVTKMCPWHWSFFNYHAAHLSGPIHEIQLWVRPMVFDWCSQTALIEISLSKLVEFQCTSAICYRLLIHFIAVDQTAYRILTQCDKLLAYQFDAKNLHPHEFDCFYVTQIASYQNNRTLIADYIHDWNISI